MSPPLTIESSGEDAGAPYDSRAAAFDRMVRSRLYNGLAWGTSPAAYEAFAAEAVADGNGPLLEAAAGSAAASAEAHARSGRPTVVSDLSRGMLERAGERIAVAAPGEDELGSRIRLVQADALDLPFPPGGFATVLTLGSLHLFEDVAALRDALLAQLEPGGRLYATGLVTATRRGGAYLRALNRAGEVAAPHTAGELRDALEPETFRLDGCMAFAVVRAPAPA